MKAKVVAPFDYSPKMKVGQEVEIDKLRRQAGCSSGFMARVVGIWEEPRWFDLGWFIPESKSAQQGLHPTKGIRPAKKALSKPKHLSTQKGLS